MPTPPFSLLHPLLQQLSGLRKKRKTQTNGMQTAERGGRGRKRRRIKQCWENKIKRISQRYRQASNERWEENRIGRAEEQELPKENEEVFAHIKNRAVIRTAIWRLVVRSSRKEACFASIFLPPAVRTYLGQVSSWAQLSPVNFKTRRDPGALRCYHAERCFLHSQNLMPNVYFQMVSFSWLPLTECPRFWGLGTEGSAKPWPGSKITSEK